MYSVLVLLNLKPLDSRVCHHNSSFLFTLVVLIYAMVFELDLMGTWACMSKIRGKVASKHREGEAEDLS